jgi:hypothetical protein
MSASIETLSLEGKRNLHAISVALGLCAAGIGVLVMSSLYITRKIDILNSIIASSHRLMGWHRRELGIVDRQPASRSAPMAPREEF